MIEAEFSRSKNALGPDGASGYYLFRIAVQKVRLCEIDPASAEKSRYDVLSLAILQNPNCLISPPRVARYSSSGRATAYQDDVGELGVVGPRETRWI